MAPPKLATLSAEQQAELARWLTEQGDTVPDAVRIALEQHAALREALGGSRQKLNGVLSQLRRALGIIAKSERRTSKDPLGPTSGGDGRKPKNALEKLKLDIERLERLKRWHQQLARKKKREMKRMEKKLEGLSHAADEPTDEPTLSLQEEAEADAETQSFMKRCALGGGPDPAFASVSEALMCGAEVTTSEETVRFAAPEPEGDNVKVIETLVEERVRYDFTVVVGRVVAEVEKKVIIDSGKRRRVIAASTDTLGPPRFGVTWRFLVNTAVLGVQYAMPMHRLSRLLSTDDKPFTAASLARVLRYVAERFCPIYVHLFDDLADAPIWMGDDTPPRVLEVNRYVDSPDPQEAPPWEAYRTCEAAQQTLKHHEAMKQKLGLEAMLASELGFEFARRRGEGPKRSLNTTVVAGRSDPNDPRSLTVFYRSHLGGLGNLLEQLLQRRQPPAGSVIVQSDLSTVNLVSDPKLREAFSVRQVGCASHARRPFALYQAEDEACCDMMLHLFKGLFINEHGLDLHGRNADNVAAVRDKDSRPLWEDIKKLAELMTHKWSRDTKLGDGARYILRHFDALTAYLDDPRLDPTNNFSERMLRLEKLIEGGSMFRATLGGRFVLDILRTVLQTAVAARVPLQEYVLYVLQSSPEAIVAAPETFTPLAWAREHTVAEVARTAGLDDESVPPIFDDSADAPESAAAPF